MRLNGWQRLWVVASGLWAVWLLIQGYEILNGISLRNALSFWALPVAVVYLSGLAVRWVVRGFSPTTSATRQI